MKDLGKISKRRNEVIADLFSRLEFVEKLGTGINKMRSWMKKYGLKRPKIETDDFFTIKFDRPIEEHKTKMSVKNVGKKEREEAILEKIKTKINFTIITLAKEFGVNDKTIERDLKELKRDNKIKFVGPKKGGRYEMIE